MCLCNLAYAEKNQDKRQQISVACGSFRLRNLFLVHRFSRFILVHRTCISGSLPYIRHNPGSIQEKQFFCRVTVRLRRLSRLPTILAFPFFLLLTYEQNNIWKPRLKQAVIFFLGLAISVGLNALYNFARYGTFLDVGYTLIPGIQQDPYFTNGIFSISYIPRHIYAILFQGPILLNSFPYFEPSWMGLGLFFTTPAFIYIFKGPWDKLSKKAALAVLCILLILITHGTVGFTQFGYRFSLDFTPFLILLAAKGMREKIGWSEKSLIILSLLVNLWGVVSIIEFNFVSF